MTRIKTVATAALMAAFGLVVPAAAQQSMSADDIVRSLQSNTPVSASSLNADAIISGLRHRFAAAPEAAPTGRSLKAIAVVPDVPAPDPVVMEASIAALPSLDMEVFFDYNSATIKPESLSAIYALGTALTDPRLGTSRFVVAGHTDATGSNGYNLNLSEARAASVRNALIATFPIDPARLSAFGFGEEQLRDPAHPAAAINRRVQVLNIGN